MISPALLARTGRTLYGAQWQSALAWDIGRNEKTVRRWASRESPIPDWLPAELARLLELRGMDIGHLLAELRELPAASLHRRQRRPAAPPEGALR